MSNSSAYVIGGITGAIAFLAIVIGLVWFCKLHYGNFLKKSSETSSSEPSTLADQNSMGETNSAVAMPLPGSQGTRQLTVEDLEKATKQFNEINPIGYGSFGPVYKGLLCDGTVVAIKRRLGVPRKKFVAEVAYLSEIQHRNLVTLLGYCQEHRSQLLVFEYVPNGSMCNHLYDTGLESSTTLEFKQRLSIALAAAKGLCHLHGLKPPLVHKNFKTANVLVDENFIAKVADAGISSLIEKIEEASSSHSSMLNVFKDPEADLLGTFSEKSDVYSFGVFLLELVTGHQASHICFMGSDRSLMKWVESQLSAKSFIDRRLDGGFTMEGMIDLIRLMQQCMNFRGRGRPNMEMIVLELERVLEKEITLTTVMGEGTTTITLGSKLFTT